jgi:hypothetical protein
MAIKPTMISRLLLARISGFPFDSPTTVPPSPNSQFQEFGVDPFRQRRPT